MNDRTMILTESEARTRWCPVRIGAYAGPAAVNCLGSACAMWRWTEPLRLLCRVPDKCVPYAEPALPEPARPDGVPSSWKWTPAMDPQDDTGGVWLEPVSEAQARMRGYCGLAGKP